MKLRKFAFNEWDQCREFMTEVDGKLTAWPIGNPLAKLIPYCEQRGGEQVYIVQWQEKVDKDST